MTLWINITDRQAAGLTELIALAERGREDFKHQAEHGDYSPAEVAEAQTRWEAAQQAIEAIHTQQATLDQLQPLEALEYWADVVKHIIEPDAVWGHYTCTEIEAIARLARSIGRSELAEMILELHGMEDDPGDDHYRPQA